MIGWVGDIEHLTLDNDTFRTRAVHGRTQRSSP